MKNIIDLLLGRRKEFTPSRKMINSIGGGNFKKVGEHFLKHFIELGNLKPGEKVLDVGCGVGRMAVPLAKYLDKNGSYKGFDIVAAGITWCREKISHEYSNFHFQLADVYNKNYNPDGKYKAAEYKFPFENESFDFVFLTSVFTHMLPVDMENYLSEIARVLKKNGKCLITFFLLHKESVQLINTGKSTQNFTYEMEGYHTTNKNNPEAATAYNEEFIQQLYKKYNLAIAEPIRYGSWCGRRIFLSYQDIIMAEKK